MQQILEGMQYVHKQNIVHLDLKPENIVCVDTTGTKIKIIDFGLASKLGEFTGFCANKTLPRSAGPVPYPSTMSEPISCLWCASWMDKSGKETTKTFCDKAADGVSPHHWFLALHFQWGE